VFATFIGLIYGPLEGTPLATITALAISITLLVSLLLSSNRFYFHTGRFPPQSLFGSYPGQPI
jgi:hypothetical protein